MMAGKFKFRFQNVLKIKEKTEESKKYQLASTQQYFSREKDKLDYLLQKQEKSISKWDEITDENKIIKIKDLQNASTQLQMVNDLVEAQENVVKKYEKKLDGHIKELVEAKQKRKTFEKIKEKDFKIFKEEQEKLETALIDQIVTYKSTVNRGG